MEPKQIRLGGTVCDLRHSGQRPHPDSGVECRTAEHDVGVLLYDDVVAEYRDFATYAAGDSPCFEEWALGVAEDAEVVAWLGTCRPVQAPAQPGLRRRPVARRPRSGAVRRAAWALLEQERAVRATVMARATQTNEVGRLATLVPVSGSRRRPAGRLLEVGASAGLVPLPRPLRLRVVTPAADCGRSGGPLLGARATGDLRRPRRATRTSPGAVASTSTRSTSRTPTRWRGWRTWSGPSRTSVGSGCVPPSASPAGSRPLIRQGDLLDQRRRRSSTRRRPTAPPVVLHSAVIAYLEEPDRDGSTT